MKETSSNFFAMLLISVEEVITEIGGIRLFPRDRHMSAPVGSELERFNAAYLEIDHAQAKTGIIFLCENKLLTRIVARLLRQDLEEIPSEIEEPFNEIVNMIYGRLKRHSSESETFLPMVIPLGCTKRLVEREFQDVLNEMDTVVVATEFGVIAVKKVGDQVALSI